MAFARAHNARARKWGSWPCFPVRSYSGIGGPDRRMTANNRTRWFDSGPANGRNRRNLAARTRPGEGDWTSKCASLPTAPPTQPRIPARLARFSTGNGWVCARHRLSAGGKEIRTVGPAAKEKPFRRAIWLLFARTYRTSGLADEIGTSRIKKSPLP